MIPSNVILRTCQIRRGEGHGTGTSFTVDVEGKQYLVTAKHVLPNLPEQGVIELFHANCWNPTPYVLTGACDDPVDIVVLAPTQQLSVSFPLPPTSKNLIYGQDVYFLGFPYGISGTMSGDDRNFPLPLVKRGILSAFFLEDDGTHLLLVDGHNNPGFSGGPLVFREQGSNNFKVAGVISSYRFQPEPLFHGETATELFYKANTGIIHAFDIFHAIDVISKNPNGCSLTK